jgi:hypothetical protein
VCTTNRSLNQCRYETHFEQLPSARASGSQCHATGLLWSGKEVWSCTIAQFIMGYKKGPAEAEPIKWGKNLNLISSQGPDLPTASQEVP